MATAAVATAMVWQWPWQALAAMGQELAADWEAQDMRATLCKLLLLWLVISMLGICLAWRAYGETVAALCYRTGPAARRSPDTGPGASPPRPRAHSLSPASPAGRNDVGDWHCASREGSTAELAKTHQE